VRPGEGKECRRCIAGQSNPWGRCCQHRALPRLERLLGPEGWAESQNHRITESQNHRMFGVGRDLCGSSSPALCRSRVTYSRLH